MKAKNRVQSELAGGPQSPFVRQDGDTSLYPVPCLVVGVGTTTLLCAQWRRDEGGVLFPLVAVSYVNKVKKPQNSVNYQYLEMQMGKTKHLG